MSGMPILRHTIASRRVLFPGTCIGIAVLAFFVAIIYPSFEQTLETTELPSGMEGMLGEISDIASPEGYLQSQFFTMLPLIVAAMGITVASYAIVGEERDGTLDLVLAQPITRSRVVIENAAAVGIMAAVATLAAYPGVMLAVVLADIDIGWGPVFWATVACIPAALFFTWMALWFSAALPSRAAAASLASLLLIVAYVVNVIGPANDVLDAIRRGLPFYWSDSSPALVGDNEYLKWPGLTIVSLVFVLLALWSFERREITPGARDWSMRSMLRWPWHRERPMHEGPAGIATGD
jgi:ABC-2 type transport system permease protein